MTDDEWDHESLRWIHKIREEHYERTKHMTIKEIIRESLEYYDKRKHEYS